MEFKHKSIMLEEVLSALDVKPSGTYLDCTLGGGGHALAIAKKLSAQGKIIGLALRRENYPRKFQRTR